MLGMKPAVYKAICLGLVLSAFLIVTAMAGTAEIIVSGTREYKGVRLTPEIYNLANRDLSDILVHDINGNPVPYFIYSYETIRSGDVSHSYPLIFMNSFVKEGDTYFDFRVETTPGIDIQATSVYLSVTSAFHMYAKNVEVLGSYDGLVWEYILTDGLFHVGDARKSTIDFREPMKYTHYRFRTINNIDELSITGGSLEYSSFDVDQMFFTENFEPQFDIEEQGNFTVIKLYGLKNVKINEMTIHTDDMFKRTVYFAGGRSKELHNLAFSDNVYQDLQLNFSGYAGQTDVLEVRIANGNDRPIVINRITLTYFTDEIIFKGQGESYSLVFGRDVYNAPVYDIVNYKELILGEGYDLLSFGGITLEEYPGQPEQRDYSFAFNIAVVSVSVLLAVIILVRLRRSG